jgi:hypothetical protein
LDAKKTPTLRDGKRHIWTPLDVMFGEYFLNKYEVNMENNKKDFLIFFWRIISTHTITYFIAGIFALLVLKYNEIFNVGALSFMRATSSPWIALGPGLQLIRGVLLALVLFPFKSIFLETKKGWLKFWLLNFGLCYILTISAAVGSFEGIIYTNLPIKYHFIGLPEIILYTVLFTTFMWIWYKKSNIIYNILSIISVVFIVTMSVFGLLASLGILKVN